MISGILLVGLFALANASMIDKFTMNKLHQYNLMNNCLGRAHVEKVMFNVEAALKTCQATPPLVTLLSPLAVKTSAVHTAPTSTYSLQYNPYVAYGRRKRHAQTPAAVTVEELLAFKNDKQNRISGLACVLRQMGFLDANNNININKFSLASLQAALVGTPAGSDPIFLQKMSNDISDCYHTANSIPQRYFNKNTFLAEHGRHMKFFMCMKMAKLDLCSKFQLASWLEQYNLIPANFAEHGVADKYEAAAMIVKVMHASESPVEQQVDKFFWAPPEEMF